MKRPATTIERWFERLIWSSRLLMVIGVIFSLLLAIGAIYLASVDAISVVKSLAVYSDSGISGELRTEVRADAITKIVKAVDGYLIAAILVIVGLGLYELFISKLEAAEESEAAPRLLLVRSLDDLKDRIAKLVLLVLVIEFFQRALQVHYGGPLDLLYLAAGILLIGGALFLSNVKSGKNGSQTERK